MLSPLMCWRLFFFIFTSVRVFPLDVIVAWVLYSPMAAAFVCVCPSDDGEPPPAEAKKDTHANVHFSLTRGEGGGTQTSPGNCAITTTWLLTATFL